MQYCKFLNPAGNLRPALTGEVAKKVEEILTMPHSAYGTNVISEKVEETYANAKETLKAFRGKLLKMDIWQNFERSFCHYNFDILNGKKVEAEVDLFAIKGSVLNFDVTFS